MEKELELQFTTGGDMKLRDDMIYFTFDLQRFADDLEVGGSSEIDNEIIPEPSNILEISREKNQAVVFIDIFMPPVRDEMKAKHIAA